MRHMNNNFDMFTMLCVPFADLKSWLIRLAPGIGDGDKQQERKHMNLGQNVRKRKEMRNEY